MKIRNALFENPQYLETMNKIHGSQQLSVTEAFHVNRLFKQIAELQTEYHELKQTVLEKYGEKSENEDPVKGIEYHISPGENMKKFTKDMNELLIIEHDLEIDKLSFPSGIDNGISVKDMDVLDLFFDFGFLGDPADPAEKATQNSKS